jgi:F0F1-type ATP synthase assembly protein I
VLHGGALSTTREALHTVFGPNGSSQLKAFARIGAVGTELAVSTVAGLLGGRWLDHKLSTEPFLTVVGLILGVVAGFVNLYRTLKASQQTEKSPPNHE